MSTKALSVEDSLLQQHAEFAAKAFQRHVVTERLNDGLFRSWRCQSPGTWCHGFDVTTTPGHLHVTGDVGDLIVSRVDDMIAWARGAVKSAHYFAEKVPIAIPTREWSYDKSLEWLNDEIEDAADEYGGVDEVESTRTKLVELRNELQAGGLNGEMDEHEFNYALHQSGLVDGCDWPDLKVFNSNFLWCREAVKWLLQNLDTKTTH